MESKSNFTKKDIAVGLLCVGFLAACLGAIGTGGRQSAKEAVCLSNLKQIGTMYAMYCNNNNGNMYSYWWPASEGFSLKRTWPVMLGPYYKDSNNVCFCPSTRRTGDRPYINTPWGPYRTYGYTGQSGSYGENLWTTCPIENKGGSYDSSIFWKTFNVKGAQNAPLLVDCANPYMFPFSTNTPPSYDGDLWSSQSDLKYCTITRHDKTINGIFLDSSTRKIGLKELWTLKWYKGSDWPVNPRPIWPTWMSNFKNYN